MSQPRSIGTSGTIGITTGDPAGIGPEVIRAALDSERLDPAYRYRLIGTPPVGIRPGQPTREGTRSALAALEESVALALRGEIDAVVTGPIHKALSQAEGFAFPGQTEFFATRTGSRDYVMLLTGGPLTVALVTAHLPLREAVAVLRTEEIVRTGHLLARFLRDRSPVEPLHLAVAGLNPHAGESGALGREEIDVIQPAVDQLAAQWEGRQIAVSGPHSPDTVFMHAAAGRYHGVLCMVHDQGLIPLKLLAFDQGVNVTLGLPIIRTSPDHGTAFDIAGQGIARPDSMIAAINLAATLATARREQGGSRHG